MEWRFELALFSSTVVFVIGLAVALLLSRRKRPLYVVRPLHVVLVATFISLVTMFYPVYLDSSTENPYQVIQAFLVSVYRAMESFVINASIDDVMVATLGLDDWMRAAYVSFSTVLCVFAPVLVFSLALSMIKSVSARWSYFLGRRRNAYVFSRLSERSLALADSTSKYHVKHPNGGKKPLIVFAGVVDEKNASAFELVEKARRDGAVLLKGRLPSVPLGQLWRSKQAETIFILIGEDRDENNTQALEILEKAETWNRCGDNTRLYVLDSSVESELLLDDFNEKMTIRRIDRVRSFVYNFLWREGKEALFDSAMPFEGALGEGPIDQRVPQREIRAHIIGVGKTGSMMLRSLAWLCQMDGYHLCVDAYDVDDGVDARLAAVAPELLDDAHNNSTEDGEASYSIRFHKGVDVNSTQFNDLLEAAGIPTFVLISLGDDDRNIEAAVRVKTLLLRKSQLHDSGDANTLDSIFVVVHDLQRTKAIIAGVGDDEVRMARLSKHDKIIKLVGSFDKVYSYHTVFAMELEEAAFKLHRYWYSNEPDENMQEEKAREFWSRESYRNSSMARKIHKDVRDRVIPEAAHEPSQRDDKLNTELAVLEHRRWLAYMRSEGYIYSGTTANNSRNDRAKIHNLLVNYHSLPEKERVLSSDSDDNAATTFQT
jgi:hypothetical protein